MGGWDTAELEAMIEEATVDAYNEDEQLTGLFTMPGAAVAQPGARGRGVDRGVPSLGRLRSGTSHPTSNRLVRED